MLNRTSRDLRQCRRCKLGEPRVRFGSLNVRLCTGCRAADREASALRVAAAREQANALLATIPAIRQRAGLSSAHLAWVRHHPCVCRRSGGCDGVMHAHHVRNGTGGGTGMKPHDRWTVPLCSKHHGELHNGGHATFEAFHGLDLRVIAADMARFSPHLSREPESRTCTGDQS